jgi:hypothetical protein
MSDVLAFLREQVAFALQVALAMVELGLRLQHFGGDFAGGDLDEQIAGLDALAEGDGHLLDRAHHLGGDHRALHRAHGAGDLGEHRGVFDSHDGDAHPGRRQVGGGIAAAIRSASRNPR